MSNAFDPYQQWLGIRDPQRPPNHYRLLGVPTFEENTNAMLNMAERRMAHVRSFLQGEHGADAQRLIQEMTAAELCLSNRQRKAEYDARLRMGMQSGHPQPPAPPPGPVPPQIGRSTGAPPLPGAAPPINQPFGAGTPPVVGATPPILPGGFVAAPQSTPIVLIAPEKDPLENQKKKEDKDASVLSWVITLMTFAVLVLVGVVVLRANLSRHAPEDEQVAVGGAGITPFLPQPEASPALSRSGTEAMPPNQPAAPAGTQLAPPPKPATPSAPSPSVAFVPQSNAPEGSSPSKLIAAPRPSASASTATLRLPPVTSGAVASLAPVASARPALPAPQMPPGAASASSPVAALLADARGAMRVRNYSLAGQRAEAAMRIAAPAEQAEVAQVQKILGYLDNFWKSVTAATGTLKPGVALPLMSGVASVVAVDSAQITLRRGDREASLPLATLSLEVAQAILAIQPVDPSGADVPGRAAALIVEPTGNKVLAAQLCEAVRLRGMSNQELLAELKLQTTAPAVLNPPNVSTSGSHAGPAAELGGLTKPATTAGDGTGLPPLAPEPPPRPVPSAQAQVKVLSDIRQLFKSDFDAAASNPDKARQLGSQLLKEAGETKDDPVAQYVLYSQARDLAVDASDVGLFTRAVAELGKRFTGDIITMQVECLQKMAKRPRPVAANAAFAKKALQVAQEAIHHDKFAEADLLLEAGKEMARRGRDSPHVKEAVALGHSMETMKQYYLRAQAAEKTLAAKPDDRQANLIRGKYLCLVRNDWVAGLPLLAKSGDPTFKKLADAEAAAASTATQPLAMGDLWWDSSNAVDEELQRFFRERAAAWYHLALPNLSGLHKTRVDRRLQDLGEAVPHR
jgi:hypothetical protein